MSFSISTIINRSFFNKSLEAVTDESLEIVTDSWLQDLNLRASKKLNPLRLLTEEKRDSITNISLRDATSSEIVEIFTLCPNLTSLDLRFYNNGPGSLEEDAQKMPENYKLVDLRICSYWDINSFAEKFIMRCQHLQTFHANLLEMPGEPLLDIFHIPETVVLKSLTLSSKSLNEKIMAQIIERFPSLEKLEIFSHDLTGQFLSHFPNDNQLQYLKLTGNHFQSDFFTQFMERYTNLQEVPHNRDLTYPNTFEAFLQNSQLNDLDSEWVKI